MMRRPDPYTLARFLDAIAAKPGLSRSVLQRAAGVNYDIFRRYMAWLEQRGWTVDDDGVQLTPLGSEVRRRMIAWVNELLGHEPP